MLSINLKNLFSEQVNDHGITTAEQHDIQKQVPQAHNTFQKWRQTKDALFYDVINDPAIIDGIPDAASAVAKNFKNIVILGIGGSSLGLRCTAQALLTPFWNLQPPQQRNNKPRLFVCDNIDPDTFSNLLSLLDPSQTCFTVISKSGKTTETAAQFFIVLEHLKQTLGNDWKKHLVFITDPQNGELRPFATEHNITTFSIPPKLGGRFSILSPVGLFPAACLGIDISAMISGAKQMADRCAHADLENNPGYAIGAYHHHFDTIKKKNISVMMPYCDALMLASDWYVQLWAESLGKNGKGQTPVKALGATDQHSQVQLYMEGPNDKVFTFLSVDEFNASPSTTCVTTDNANFSYIQNTSLGTILQAEQKATCNALTKESRPNLTVSFPKVDATHLGEFFMLYEIATAFAGALYNFDPFTQPGVELGKKLTKEILLSSK